MRNFRSISDYLSLGTPPAQKPSEPLRRAELAHGPRPFARRDVVVAERLTVKHIRDAVVELVKNGVPPCSPDRFINGYIDRDGGLVFVKRGASVPDGAEVTWYEPLPGAAEFGPYYDVRLPAVDMAAILGDPEFQAGEAAGEFRVAGKGVIMVRPPAGT